MYLVRSALALEGPAKVIDDHVGTATGEEGGIGFAQASTCASDDDRLAVEAKLGHDGRTRELVGRRSRYAKETSYGWRAH